VAVEQRFTGNTTQLLAEYDKILARTAKLEQKLAESSQMQRRRMTDELGMAETIEKQNSRGLSKLKELGAQFVTISGSISLVRAGIQQWNQMLEEQKNLYGEISQRQSQIASAQLIALKNFAGLQTVQKQETLDEIKKPTRS